MHTDFRSARRFCALGTSDGSEDDMAMSAADRNLLHNGISAKVGEREAAILMEHLPPTGWADVATKRDLAELEVRIGLRFDGLGERFVGIDRHFGEVDRRFGEVDRHFDDIDRRFGEMDRRFGDIDRRFGDIDRRFGDIDRRFEEMIANSNDRFAGIDRRLDALPDVFATRKDLEALMHRNIAWMFSMLTIFFGLFTALVIAA
jgi:hypothetical protein